ncbi:hypothetical protein [Porticoccus sp.]|uniref:hypothetical protein n=1 Tax=Porticoccus sp. TaxID=2024853 RepID=UPI003F6963F7
MDSLQRDTSWHGLFNYFLILSLLLLLTKLNIAALYQINWDEFYFLSKVHDYLRGDLGRSIQTFHVHFFGWLPWISVNEVNQIVVARMFMVLLQLLTAIFLYQIARQFFLKSTAFFVVISYFSVQYILLLGSDFRADPIATFLLVLSINLMLSLTASLVVPAVIGLLLALSLMITIKSAFYLPVIGLLYLVSFYQPESRHLKLKQGFIAIFSLIGSLLMLYYLHKASIGEATGEVQVALSESYLKTIASQTFFPRLDFFIASLKQDFVFWILVLTGLLILIRAIILEKDFARIKTLQLFVLALPLLTLLFYRNAFPYYYSFMLATPALLAGVCWEKLMSHSTGISRVISKLLLGFFTFVILYKGFATPFNKNMHSQQEMLTVIHQLFPEPVHYIDRCSMVSSFKKEGFFMSTWGTESYREAGEPIFGDIIEEQQPKFLLANKLQLDLGLPDEVRKKVIHPDYDLLGDDLNTLRENYIPHWGKLYVAGKYLVVSKPNKYYEIKVLIEGKYTFEGGNPVILNDQKLLPGEVVFLKKGVHRAMSSEAGVFAFRWGEHLPTPEKSPPDSYLFSGF